MPARLAMRSVLTLALFAFAAGCLAAVAGAQEQQRTLVSVGLGQAKVTVAEKDRKANAAIVAAVEKAEEAALPRAIAEAREYAEQLATGAGVTLGALLSVSNESGAPFGSFYFSGPPPFGPDQYCGDQRRPVTKRTAAGKRKVVRVRTVRVCRIPPQVAQTVKLTYAIS